MTRQTLHPDDRRDVRFPVSLSKSEAELIDQAAAQTLDSRAEFMRYAAKAEARRVLSGKRGKRGARSEG